MVREEAVASVAAARERKAAKAALGRSGTSAASSIPVDTTPAFSKDPRATLTSTRRLFAGSQVSTGGLFPTAPSTNGRFPGVRTSTGSPRIPAALTSTLAAQSPWMPPRPLMNPAYLDPINWDHEPTPDGGFLNFLRSESHLVPENSNLVGGTNNLDISQFYRSPVVEKIGTLPMSQPNVNGNVDNEEQVRTEKRIVWTPEEDSMLMSAWLKCSMDSIQGNDKRNDQYWNDVVDTYNLTTPAKRKRNMKQAKDRWHRINKLAELFHSAYLKARRIYKSGYNDQMWIKEAQTFYQEDNKEYKLGRFVLMDVWNAIRDQPKWLTYNDELKKARKRKTSSQGDEEVREEEEEEDHYEIPGPTGQKAAKKAAYESNVKSKHVDSQSSPADDEDVLILKEAHANRLKVLEKQEKLSADRLESAKLAKETKTLDITAKMMDTYNCLLAKDVQLMTEEENVEHVAMLKHLKNKLYPGI